MGKVLIIDDENQLRGLLARIIGLEGYEVIQADSCKAGLKQVEQQNPDVIICDVRLPDGSGVDLITEMKRLGPLTEIILLTAHGNIPDGVQAIKNGAFDYITKGDDNNKIIPLLSRAMEKVEMARRLQQLEKQVGQKYSFESILGKSKPIRMAVELARKVSVSEIFGHKAGAFTGALKEKKGLFEEADQGTIFLDEIGEMAFDLQAKLLRVLESGEFIKVGDTRPIKVNVRIIAATNRDLQKEIEAGHFREDLYYRLSVFRIQLPPLRERIEDIELYVRAFVKMFGPGVGKKIEEITPEYLGTLKKHVWKGNVRELRNVIERSMIIADGAVLTVSDLPFDIQQSVLESEGGKGYSEFDLAQVEKAHIRKVLQYTGGNKTEAARLMHIGLTTLYRKIEECGIR